MKHMTHDGRVSVRELAVLLQVSTDTIRRAYRKGELPAVRVRTALRFNLDEVRLCMRRNAEARYGRNPGAPGGNCRPRAGGPPAPGLVTRGHYPQGSLQEVYGFDEFSIYPHR